MISLPEVHNEPSGQRCGDSVPEQLHETMDGFELFREKERRKYETQSMVRLFA